MNLIAKQCNTSITKVFRLPLFASASVLQLTQTEVILRLTRKHYCGQTKLLLNYSSVMLGTASSKGRSLLCWRLAPVLNNRIVTNMKESHNFKCYHTTHSHLVHDAGTTSKEYSEDSIHRPKNIESLIETWFYEVCPRGSLEASLPFRTEIRPLNPENYPYMNKVIIQLHFNATEGAEIPSTHQLSQISDLYDLRVGFDEDKANMKISCDVISGVFVPITCTLLVPLQFGKLYT